MKKSLINGLILTAVIVCILVAYVGIIKYKNNKNSRSTDNIAGVVQSAYEAVNTDNTGKQVSKSNILLVLYKNGDIKWALSQPQLISPTTAQMEVK